MTIFWSLFTSNLMLMYLFNILLEYAYNINQINLKFCSFMFLEIFAGLCKSFQYFFDLGMVLSFNFQYNFSWEEKIFRVRFLSILFYLKSMTFLLKDRVTELDKKYEWHCLYILSIKIKFKCPKNLIEIACLNQSIFK